MSKMNIPFDCVLEIFKASEIAEAKQAKRIVEGFASIADFPDFQNDVITGDAIQAASQDLVGTTLLWNHNQDAPIGHVIESEARPQGLYIKAEISHTEEDVWNKVVDGTISKFSIRGIILEAFRRYVEEMGKELQFIRRMKLVEASLVSLPAQPKAAVVRWYLEKALSEFCKSGGSLPTEKKGGEYMAGEQLTAQQELDLLNQVLAKAAKKDKTEQDQEEIKSLLETLKQNKEKYPYPYPKPDDKKKEHEMMDEERRRKLEEKEKQITELSASLDKAKKEKDEMEGKQKSLEEQLKQASSERDALKSSGEQAISALQQQVTTLQAEITEQKSMGEMESMWSELVGKSYRPEDAETIKPILKKQILKQALSKEELTTLIQKKISGGTGIVVSNVGDGSAAMSPEKEAVLARQYGIHLRTDSPLSKR